MKLEFPPGALREVGPAQMDRARALAETSPRQRAIVRYHQHDEPVQRMLNALRRGTYVRPHRHADPDKVELFLILEGRARVLRFDDQGGLLERVTLDAEGPVRGCEIPPRQWHTLICDSPTALLFEVIQGPFSATTHKRFAPWAPEEGSPQAADWLARFTCP